MIYRPEIKDPKYAFKIGVRYGEDFLRDIHTLWTDDNIRLNDVALKHGITREWVRQLFNKLYGTSYTKLKERKILAHKRKIAARKQKEEQKRLDLEWRADNLKGYSQDHAAAQMLVHDICVDLGYEVSVERDEKHAKPVIIVNNHRVAVSWCSQPHMAGQGHYKWPYWRFGSAKSRWENIDFAVLCAAGDESFEQEVLFFIVPKSLFPAGAMIFIRQGKSDYHAAKNKYYPYLGAWHLLEGKGGKP